jgi:hypothetical protein
MGPLFKKLNGKGEGCLIVLVEPEGFALHLDMLEAAEGLNLPQLLQQPLFFSKRLGLFNSSPERLFR